MPSGPGDKAGPHTGTEPGDRRPGERRPGARRGPRRDADASREAILAAARRAFARRPYADITVRAIAEDAGVSPPLVIKYFGSKERLFARLASFADGVDELLDAPLEDLGAHLVRQLVEQHHRGRGIPIVRIAFAPMQGEHAETLRRSFRTHVVGRLADRLPGPDARLRAELVVAQLVGLGILVGIAHDDALARTAPAQRLVELYGPGLQRLIDAPGA